MISPQTDLKANVKAVAAGNAESSSAPVLLIAGGTGDGVKVDGETVDRLGYSSAVCAIGSMMTLAQDETISYAIEYQDSADGSTWNTAVALQASTALSTGGAGGSTERAAVYVGMDCTTLERYIRFNITPAFSASSTDTGSYGSVAILGGPDVMPAS